MILKVIPLISLLERPAVQSFNRFILISIVLTRVPAPLERPSAPSFASMP